MEGQRNFYDRSFRSLFALVVLFRKEQGGPLHKHVFNFLSQDLSNDAQFVTQCLKKVCTCPHNFEKKSHDSDVL